MTRHRLRVIHAYLRLPHAVPIIVVMSATAAFTVIAADGLPARATLVDLLLAMLCAQIVIGTVNELADVETDAWVKPNKPIPAGLVSRRGARTLALIALAGMVWFSAHLGWEALVLCALGTVVGVSYSLWFKRSLLAWLPYFVALPLLPIWVFTATAGFDARLLMLYPLGAVSVAAVHLSQSLPDIAADRASGVRNLTSALGEQTSFLLCIISKVLSALIAIAAASTWGNVPTVVAAAGGIVVAAALAEAGLYLLRPRIAVMVCFPCVAIGTVILGAGWTIAITR